VLSIGFDSNLSVGRFARAAPHRENTAEAGTDLTSFDVNITGNFGH
jgi:hypothetical protein